MMKGIVEGLSRVLLCSPFLYLSIRMLIYPREMLDRFLEANLPLVPVLFVLLLSMLLIGSASLFLGYRTKSAAIILLIVSIPSALLLFPSSTNASISVYFCWLAIIGGLIRTTASSPGSFSLDEHYKRPVRKRR